MIVGSVCNFELVSVGIATDASLLRGEDYSCFEEGK